MGYKTANSIEKEVTFYCKLRTELALNAPYYYGNPSTTGVNINPNLRRNGAGIHLEERSDMIGSRGAYNRVHNLVDFGEKVGDWTNSYSNGVWTVNATKDWEIDLNLKLQSSIGPWATNSEVNTNNNIYGWRNSQHKGEIDGGIVGMIRIYKIPASSNSVIPSGGIINPFSSNPFIDVADIVELYRQEFAIVYNQNQSAFGNDFNSGVFGSGTGSIKPVSNGPAYTWNGLTNSTSTSNISNPAPPSQTGKDEGEYYSSMGTWYSIDNAIGSGSFNKINNFSTVKSNNEYLINTIQSLEIGDRVFVVVSGSFNQFASTINSQPNPVDINNAKRTGGILYQWNGSGGGDNKRNQPIPSVSNLFLHSGSFNAKTVL